MKKTNKLNIGMIGMGYISEVHLKAFARRDDINIVAMSDNNQGQLLKKAKRFGVKATYPDYHEMLKDEAVEVVDIMTPHSLHKEHVCDALLAGKTVICEKPVTTNSKDLDEIIKTIKKTGKKVYIKQYLRHSLAWQKFQEQLESGIIGTPYLSQCLFTGYAADKFTNPYTWRGNKIGEGGGVFVDIAVHMLDRLESIFGTPKIIYGKSKKVTAKLAQKGEDVAVAVVQFSGNVLANFTMTQCDPGFGFRWEVKVFGTKGILEISDVGKEKKLVKVIIDNKIAYEFEEENWWEECNLRALDDIVDRIKNQEDPLVEMKAAKSVIDSLELFYKLSGDR